MSDKVSVADNQQERLLSQLLPDYIVGLVDGEGYFSVTARIDKSKSYESLRVQMVFGIKLREKDGAILERVRSFFNCGYINRVVDIRPTFSNCLEYQVRDSVKIRDIIIPFFEKHTLQIESKRKSFEKFCIVVDMFHKKTHLQRKGFLMIKSLAKQLHQ